MAIKAAIQLGGPTSGQWTHPAHCVASCRMGKRFPLETLSSAGMHCQLETAGTARG